MVASVEVAAEYTRPLASTAKPPLARLVMWRLVVVALVVGGIEALGLVAAQLNLRGAFWDLVGRLNNNFGTLGYFDRGTLCHELDCLYRNLPMATV